MREPQALHAPAVAVHPPGWLPLVGMYALHFGTVGILLPFLPAYLKSLSLSASQVGQLLALGPVMILITPSLIAGWADRTGRLDRALTLISFGAFAGLLPLVRATGFAEVALALALYHGFSASMTSLLDGLALHRVNLVGGSYARLRLFGSLGFVCSSVLFGALVREIDAWTVLVPVALVGAYSIWSLSVRSRSATVAKPARFAALGLLRERDILLLLLASMTHWIACAPYHGTFSIHIGALELAPWVVGASAGLGVLAEIGVMYLYPLFADRISPRHLLAVGFAASALRWWGMAVATSAEAVFALSLLHGLTFGAFYVASVAFLTRRVPSHLRASGQALYASITFGVGGLVGYPLAGRGYDLLGGHRLFAVAGVVELLALALVLFVHPAATQPRE